MEKQKTKATTNTNTKETNHTLKRNDIERLRNKRLSILEKGKIKKIGLMESLRLKIQGYSDGSHGLPVKTDNNWISPRIDKEINSYEEFCSRIFGSLQIELEEKFAHLGNLIDSISHTQNELEIAKEQLGNQLQKYSSSLMIRKKGEDNLTEAQVQSRRQKERDKYLSSARGKVSSIESQLSTQIEDFYALKNRIVEDYNSTKLICNRAKDYILQRIDIYWDSAYKKHPESKMMPAIPRVVFLFNAEKVYSEQHKELMSKAESLAVILSATPDKEVA